MNEEKNYEDVMVEETAVEEVGERDFSTAIGVGLIAAGGVVAYEGGKRVVKFAKAGIGKLKEAIALKRGEKESAPAGDAVEAEVKVEK